MFLETGKVLGGCTHLGARQWKQSHRKPMADFRNKGKGKPLVVNGNPSLRKWEWKKPAF